MKQWYIMYKDRAIAEQHFEVLCVDIDHTSLKFFMPNNCAKFNGEIPR